MKFCRQVVRGILEEKWWKSGLSSILYHKWELESCMFQSWLRLVSLVQFSHSVMSDSLRPHGLQHTRPPCPSPNPGACSDSCPSSRWCHPTISSSVAPLSSHLQSFPASWSFPVSQFFTSGGQSIGVSALVSVLPNLRTPWTVWKGRLVGLLANEDTRIHVMLWKL